MFDGLTFADVPMLKAEELQVRVAVLSGGRIKVSFNAGAYAKLGACKALKVGSARKGEASFLRLQPSDSEGWPLTARTPPKVRAARMYATCVIETHPFTIGVVHPAVDVKAEWTRDGVMLAMPDWPTMLADLSDASED